MNQDEIQQKQDEEHLRLISIGHYIVAGLGAMAACFPIIHLLMGIAMVSGQFNDSASGKPPPAFVGWMFIIIPIFIIILGWAFAISVAIAGRYIAAREKYTFCLIMAGISCMFMPIGTVLGAFTFTILMRPTVKELFQANKHKDYMV